VSENESEEFGAYCRSESNATSFAPNFELTMGIRKDGTVCRFVAVEGSPADIEVSESVFAELTQLQLAGELRGLRGMLQEALAESFDGTILSVLKEIADR
jgi:hypothetical protein